VAVRLVVGVMTPRSPSHVFWMNAAFARRCAGTPTARSQLT
jgi:hypothetical protein